MIDLIYDSSAVTFIQERFPHVKVTDASDEIHEGRVEIELPDSDKDDFYKDSIRKGYHQVSFHFQLMLRGSREEDINQIKKWLKEIEEEKDK